MINAFGHFSDLGQP